MLHLSVVVLSHVLSVVSGYAGPLAGPVRSPSWSARRVWPPSALIGDEYLLESPSDAATVGKLLGTDAVERDGDAQTHWVALTTTPFSAPAPIDLSTLGDGLLSPAKAFAKAPDAPIAVGCLDLASGTLASLRCSIPKEKPAALQALGAVTDALLLRWAQHVTDAKGVGFDSLTASASLFSRDALTARGFVEIESPDLSVRPIQTHRASLGSCADAVQAREQSGSTADVKMGNELLAALLKLRAVQQREERASVAEASTSGQTAEEAAEAARRKEDELRAVGRRMMGLR